MAELPLLGGLGLGLGIGIGIIGAKFLGGSRLIARRRYGLLQVRQGGLGSVIVNGGLLGAKVDAGGGNARNPLQG
jgi:hypothetical protein